MKREESEGMSFDEPTLPCLATHYDAMCLLPRGHSGNHNDRGYEWIGEGKDARAIA
jgi:hypothetical protein